MCLRQQSWIDARLLEKIYCGGGLFDEVAQQVHREVGIITAQYCSEVILERSYELFGCVVAMQVWWHKLILYIVFNKILFDECRAFVVKYLH